jgi:hypothetical protein
LGLQFPGLPLQWGIAKLHIQLRFVTLATSAGGGFLVQQTSNVFKSSRHQFNVQKKMQQSFAMFQLDGSFSAVRNAWARTHVSSF